MLDAQTDKELRAACYTILQNFKPSDHGMEDTDPKLDFGGLQRPRQHRVKERNDQRGEVRVRMPTGAPVDLKTALEARGLKQTELTLKTPAKDLPARANSSRRRADSGGNKQQLNFAWLDDRDEKREQNLRKYVTSTTIMITIRAMCRTASLISCRSSSTKRSQKLDNPAAADAAATEWMAQHRDHHDASQPQARPPTARTPSRSKSIKENIKGFASRSISRAQSVESLRTTDTNVSQDTSQDPPHSGSAAGWRGWSLRRGGSSRSASRPGTSRGQPDESEQPKQVDKNVVNLNRELPPLPSLDSWKDAQKPQVEVVKSPLSPTHIASVMRPHEQQQQERSSATRKTHRRSGSDTLALQYNAAYATRSPLHSTRHIDAGSRSKTLTPDSLTALEGMTIHGSVSTSNLSHIHQKSQGSSTTPKRSCEVVNFSRKMSMDAPLRTTYSKEVNLSRKEEQKSRLKKVFTGWMSKKDKKEDWMHKLEKQGVKEGVLVQDSPAGAPVVRY